ncbi:4Fe-4S binding protein [Acetivibrio ethanolgignens]|uniref:4Fe-4S ferredoxin n=1 Tax=Acetivibrio ethanolgignens TaxID=290052 RepID=A0A0V8QCK0_9FIRM|nr:4Fe-4S binding protein [Acetivibrio ethanolgignens]KSV58320.1 4Fe-4S ferredoxin [Acetivibrio ethanolgignens]
MVEIKNPVKRKLIQLIAFGYSNAHLLNFKAGSIYKGEWKKFCNPGLNCYSCPAATFACPIGALQAVNGSRSFNFSFYVVGILLAFGVLFGRFICGWLCPFGLFQELIHKIPSPKLRLKKGFLYIKYAVLIIFVILLPIVATNYMGMGKPAFCQFICPAGTLGGGIPLLATNEELRQTIGSLFFLKMAILIGTIAGCIFIYRFFCRTLCPLGAIYGLMNKISLYRLEVDKDKCVNCGKCKRVCKMEVDPVKVPDSPECIRCGACAYHCPKEAIHTGFAIRASKCTCGEVIRERKNNKA